MWKVKIDRPEEMHDSPLLYYTKEEVERYSKSKSMKRKQERLVSRLIWLMAISPPGVVLDMGCGPGYSTNFLEEMGFSAFGIDVVPEMLEEARKKGLKTDLVDMRGIGEKFGENSFDHIISISAFQWINLEEVEKVAKGCKKVLKKGGILGVQFYPKSEQEMEKIGKVFSKNGFTGNFIVDNEGSPRKRTVYMVLKSV
jgi:18S rRNA (guanine1575-N7)-methyltransferase